MELLYLDIEILDIYLYTYYLDVKINLSGHRPKKSTMNVLLTGATGYIGSAVTKAWQVNRHQAVGISRSTASNQRLEFAGVCTQLLLNWTPTKPSVLVNLTKDSYRLTAIAA
jgi:hypothetical protein